MKYADAGPNESIYCTPAQSNYIIQLTDINGLGAVTDYNRIKVLNKRQASDMIKIVLEYGKKLIEYNRGNTKCWTEKERLYNKIISEIGYLRKEKNDTA